MTTVVGVLLCPTRRAVSSTRTPEPRRSLLSLCPGSPRPVQAPRNAGGRRMEPGRPSCGRRRRWHSRGPGSWQPPRRPDVQLAQRRGFRDELGPVNFLDRDQADEVRVRLVVIEGQLGEPTDSGHRAQVLDVQLPFSIPDGRICLLERCDVEPLLASPCWTSHRPNLSRRPPEPGSTRWACGSRRSLRARKPGRCSRLPDAPGQPDMPGRGLR
jgi:hypothetical protein